MSTIRCTAAGDAMIFRPLPGEYEGFGALRAFLMQGDFRFVNLETTVHNFETYGSALSGGSWFCAQPQVLGALKAFGFNMLTTANNHAMDYSHAGLLKTLDYIHAAGFQSCGTGKTLADASAPVYLDTLSGRIALIGACSTFHPDEMAGEQTRMMIGRPGLNGIRHKVVWELPKEQLDQLRAIAQTLPVNARHEVNRADGYASALPEGQFEFGDMLFREAPHAAKKTILNETDMRRMENAIREACFMADYVVVSMHSHEFTARKEDPEGFYVEFAHRCIDAGANAVVGTGPHLLRPIEIYQGCPIFYSLGDFIIELETIRKAPSGMFEKQGMTGNEGLDAMFTNRSDGGKKGLYYQKVMFESVVPYWEAEDGKLTKLQLLPVELGFGQPRSHGGLPHPEPDGGILERLAEMSAPWGTKITVEKGIGTVTL